MKQVFFSGSRFVLDVPSGSGLTDFSPFVISIYLSSILYLVSRSEMEQGAFARAAGHGAGRIARSIRDPIARVFFGRKVSLAKRSSEL